MAEGAGASPKEGWYEDPSDRHEYRWFSAGKPTSLVKDGTATSRDPLSITDPAAFHSMELTQPPDQAPLLQSAPAVLSDAYGVGPAWTILDPPPQSVESLARRLTWRRNPAAYLVAALPLGILLTLIWLQDERAGVIALLGVLVVGFFWHRGWVFLAGAFLLVGIGAASYLWFQSTATPGGPQSYLLAGRGDLVFVQWHQPTSSGDITGTITFASLAGQPPAETVAVDSSSITGQMSSAAPNVYDGYPSISLTLTVMDDSLSGIFQNGKLVLDVPYGFGVGGGTYMLARSDPAAYDAALRTLNARNQRANKLAVAHR